MKFDEHGRAVLLTLSEVPLLVYCDPGRALNAALTHVPAGHRWCVQPDDRLLTAAATP